jgi:hypothetical protein
MNRRKHDACSARSLLRALVRAQRWSLGHLPPSRLIQAVVLAVTQRRQWRRFLLSAGKDRRSTVKRRKSSPKSCLGKRAPIPIGGDRNRTAGAAAYGQWVAGELQVGPDFIDATFSCDPAAISRVLGPLMTAYLSGNNITRLDYVQDSANFCHL